MDELEQLDAVEQAALVNRGEVKPVELVDAAIARIEARDGALNAVVTRTFEQARALASQVDVTAPLAGVPFLVKDQLDWAGVRTTSGSAFRRDHVATATSPILQRWLDAGVVPVGKTNVPEAGLLATTEPEAYGPSRNPWDPTRTTGGSSGGSAAAVAAGMVPVASASDGGGSIRIPSAACGVFGLKPTRGRTPGGGWAGLSVTHVVSRSVRDNAAFLDAACGPVPGDTSPLARPAESYLASLDRPLRRLRIAVGDGGFQGVRYQPEVLASVRRLADALSDLGHEVVEGRPELTPELMARTRMPMDRLVAAGTARGLDQWSEAMGRPLDDSQLEPLTVYYAELGRAVTATELLEAFEAQAELCAVASAFFAQHDAWLLPTVAEVAPKLGEWQFPAHDPTYGWLRMLVFIPPFATSLANITGQPAVSVPVDPDPTTGLPIGAMLYGRWGEEATLLQLSAEIEQARPWRQRRPGVTS
jgi:Asp-tRNA(Asn)/Glu-tRNA(Gln) amidotransferase A subunit family amidase